MSIVNVGDVLNIYGKEYKVLAMKGSWIRFGYKVNGHWQPRGRTEVRSKVENDILNGNYKVLRHEK